MFSNPVDQFHHFKIQPNLIDVGTRLWGIKTHKLYSSEPCTEVYCFRLNFKILTSPSSLHVAPPLPPQDLSSCTPFFLFYVLKESSKISPHSTPPPQKKGIEFTLQYAVSSTYKSKKIQTKTKPMRHGRDLHYQLHHVPCFCFTI